MKIFVRWFITTFNVDFQGKKFPLFDYEAPSYATVKRWYNEFNRVRHSLTDEFRKGRPKSVIGPENINAV